MTSTIKERLDLFVDNTNEAKTEFTWQPTTARVSALMYTLEKKVIDCQAIKACKGIVKEGTNLISYFRDLSVATLLSLSKEPEKLFSDTLFVYGRMKDSGFQSSSYLAVAAIEVASRKRDFGQAVQRAWDFYDGMKKRHFFATSSGDYIFSAMLGASDLETSETLDKIELLNQNLRGRFFDSSVQSLAQVLALCGKTDTSADDVLSLVDSFKQLGIRLKNPILYPSVGLLSLVPDDHTSIASNVKEAVAYIRAKKGFEPLRVDEPEILLPAIMIIVAEGTETVDSLIRGLVENTAIAIALSHEAIFVATSTTHG
jgi:hypothetical protein